MDTSAGIIVGRPFGGTVILYIGYRPPLKSLMQGVGAFVPWLFTQTLDLSYAVMCEGLRRFGVFLLVVLTLL